MLTSHAQGVWVAGGTETAVENAVWDLLCRVGYRSYVPDPAWEIVPSDPNLSIDVTAREHPEYYDRNIWFTYGTWSDLTAGFQEWRKRNRLGASIFINSGHSYPAIIAANQTAFDANPEYYALVSGVRQSDAGARPNAKFCIANPGRIVLFCGNETTLQRFAE